MVVLEFIGSANLIVTPFILLMLAAVSLLDKKFAPTGRRALWIMVMIGLVWPFAALLTPHQPAVPIAVNLPAVSESAPMQATPNVHQDTLQPIPESNQLDNFSGMWDMYFPIEIPAHPPSYFVPDVQESTQAAPQHIPQIAYETRAFTFRLPELNINILLVAAWIAGMIIFAVYQWLRHFKLMRFLKRWEMPVSEDIAAVFEAEKYRMGIGKHIRLVHVKKLTTTMLAGLLRPTIYLADMDHTTEELTLIFRHELMHYKRKDLWYKSALAATRCLYWYNPAVHLMARQADKDLEALCDHATIQGMDMDGRKNYGNLILRMAAEPVKSPLTTHISGGKNMLKQRLTNILQTNRPTSKRFLITLGIALLLTGFFVGIRFSQYAPAYDYDAAHVAAVDFEAYSPDISMPLAAEETPQEEAPQEELPNDTDNAFAMLRSYMPIPDNMQERMRRREAAGLLPYADNVAQLHGLVFAEPRLATHSFDNVISLIIHASSDNVRITQGGEALTIRIYEWLEGHYMLSEDNGRVQLDFSVPYFNGRHGTNNFSGFFGNTMTFGDNIIFDGWLYQYLSSRGDDATGTIEIIIPEGMMPYVNINQSRGYTYISGIEIEHITINASMGDIIIKNAAINHSSINASMSSFEMRNTCFTDMTLNMSMGNIDIALAENVSRYDISVSASMGNMTLGGISATANELRNASADSRLRINASMGNVTITDPIGSEGSGRPTNDFGLSNNTAWGGMNNAWMGNDTSATFTPIPPVSPVPPNLPADVPLIGIQTMPINAGYRDLFQLPSVGVMVTGVVPHSGAEAAGIQVRDLIVAFDGRQILTQQDLSNARNTASAGQEIVLTIYRDGERLEIEVTLG